LAKALRYIAAHFSEDIDIDTVARAAGISRRGLHQAFIEHLGLTPGEHIRSTRIEHAKRLLGESNNKVESVAFLCGYQSVYSFFIAFKQACGVPPGEFRKQALLGRVLKQDGEPAVA
jgi:LacI family transcriptional regulator